MLSPLNTYIRVWYLCLIFQLFQCSVSGPRERLLAFSSMLRLLAVLLDLGISVRSFLSLILSHTFTFTFTFTFNFIAAATSSASKCLSLDTNGGRVACISNINSLIPSFHRCPHYLVMY